MDKCAAVSPARQISADSVDSHVSHRPNRLESAVPERWMSGLSRTPGKRVRVNSPSGVRIPLSPPPDATSKFFNLRQLPPPPSPLTPSWRRESEAPARLAWGFERSRLQARPGLAREQSDRGSRIPRSSCQRSSGHQQVLQLAATPATNLSPHSQLAQRARRLRASPRDSKGRACKREPGW